MVSAFVRADYDFITKSGLEGWFDLVENVALQTSKPDLHDNMLNGECIHLK